MLEKALENYKKAAAYPDSAVYAFALYKQGWCYFNLATTRRRWTSGRPSSSTANSAAPARWRRPAGKGGSRRSFAKRAGDFVRAYERSGGTPDPATQRVSASWPRSRDDLWEMYKTLANLYYDDGKDKLAALAYNMLIKERPLSPEAPGFQAKIVDCVLRAGNKKADRAAGPAAGEDHWRRGEERKRQDRRRQEGPQRRQGAVRAHPLQPRRQLAQRGEEDARRRDLRRSPTRSTGTTWRSSRTTPRPTTCASSGPSSCNDNLHRYDKAAVQYTEVVKQDGRRIDGEKDAAGNGH